MKVEKLLLVVQGHSRLISSAKLEKAVALASARVDDLWYVL